MRELPRGTVTFLFTDIEGSTRLLGALGEGYAEALAEHRRLLREAFAAHGGIEVDTQGDAFFAAFERATDAVACANAVQDALDSGPFKVRMGIHTGEPVVTDEGYVGLDVHRAARIASAAHGGQVLLSQASRDLVEANLRDLGDHRLKDLTAPVRLYQLGHAAFPPLRTLGVTNLPVAASPLLGREQDVREAVERLAQDTRVLTITGAGGTGKTRLALQVAAEIADAFPDGVFFVALASLTDPALVIPTIATAIGSDDDLAGHLRLKRILLLLDNAEHLLPAAPALARLVDGAPELKLLVTSRAPLRIRAEELYPLEPLAEAAAAVLFVERARAAGARVEADTAVLEICRRLDGLPLAIELAAARTRLLQPASLLERLGRALPLLTEGARDVPQRQQTLRATIEWSFELLDPPTRALLARLSVFAGTFSLSAAEEVCSAELELLAALVDMSLLKSVDDGRFMMLATIREFAAEQLEASGEADRVRRRLREWALLSAEEAYVARVGPRQAETLRSIRAEHANLWAALDACTASGEWEAGLRLAAALAPFWAIHGHALRGRRALEDLLRPRQGPPQWRARALNALATFFLDEQDGPQASRQVQLEARRLFEEAGDVAWVARCDNGLAWGLMLVNELSEAVTTATSALEAAEAIGDERLAMLVLNTLGWAQFNCGEFAAAGGHFRRSQELSRQLRDDINAIPPLLGLGGTAILAGDLAEGEAILGEAFAQARDAPHAGYAATAAYYLGRAALARDDRLRAERLFRESLAFARDFPDWPQAVSTLHALAGTIAPRSPAESAALLAASEKARETLGLPVAPLDEDFHREVLDLVASLDPGGGVRPLLSLEEAVGLALGPEAGAPTLD